MLTSYNGLANGNLPRFLPRIVEAVRAGSLVGEIVLADDGSEDDSPAWIREHFPDIRLLALTPNRGFSVAANAAFAACRYPRVALLSNDMVPHPDWLSYLEPHLLDPLVFAASARLVYEDGRPQSDRRAVRMKWGRFKRYVSSRPTEEEAATRRFNHFGDAWSLFDREKFLELGGFDEGLFLPFFSEDEDLFYRAWKRGWHVIYEPRSRVIHCHECSTIFRAYDDARRQRIYRAHQFLYTWKNLDDPRLRLQHFLSLVLRASLSWIFDRQFYAALRYALGRRHLLRTSRANRGPQPVSDREVMQRMLEEG